MRIRIPLLARIDTTPKGLEIGGCGECSEEVYLQGLRESSVIRGRLTFPDGSKEEGTREIELGEPIFRMGGTLLESEGMGFQPYEYFAPHES